MKINNGIGKQHHNPLTYLQSMRCILIDKKIKHIHYNDLYGPGGHEIYKLVDPSFVIITTCIYLICLIHAPV